MPNEKDNKSETWRTRFNASKKAERKKNVLILLFLLIALFIGYNWWTGELKFLGRKTELVEAVVIKERMIHLSRGRYYYQLATFEYIVKGKKYQAEFDIWKNQFLVQVGDSLTLKIASNKPEISKLY